MTRTSTIMLLIMSVAMGAAYALLVGEPLTWRD
jgi:hypothetical protein